MGGPNDAHGEEVEWPDADAGAIELVDAGGPNADASATERRDAGEVPEVDAGGSAPLDAGTPDADAGSEQSRDAGPVIAPDSGATEQPDAGPGVLPDGGAVELPIKKGSWTYYGAGQGLPPSVMDVSADEGGNVYVAGGDGLYVKTRTDEHFLRFDSENAGFTKNCNDKSYAHCGKEPSGCAGAPLPKPMYQCRILSVAGASAGKAIIGYEGFGDEIQDWTGWASATGGADVVAFDPGKKTMSRTRHVWIASPPHTVCNGPIGYEGRAPPGYACPTPDRWWTLGRPLVRKIYRIAVNHDASSARYGDAWFCSDHAAFAALFNNAAARKLFDRTAEYPEFADAKDVWEHLHPVVGDPGADWLNEPCFGLSIAPDGLPWATNEYRTPYISYPEADLSWEDFDMSPRVTGTCPAGSSWCPPATYGFDIWPDPWDAAHSAGVYAGATFDAVHSLSHCPDGTLWIGSYQQGLARMDPDRSIHVDTGVKDPIMTVACDPLDSSVWIGFLYGGIGRFHNGVLEHIDVAGAPEFAQSEVQSIQIDRWVTGSRRIIYFAFGPRSDGGRNALGGLGSYDGP